MSMALGTADPQTRNTMEWVMLGLGTASGAVMALTSLEGVLNFSRLSTIGKTVTLIQFAAGTTLTVACVYLGVRKYKRNRGTGGGAGFHVYRPAARRSAPDHGGFRAAGPGHGLGGGSAPGPSKGHHPLARSTSGSSSES